MDMQELGYYLFMEEQEKQEHEKVNADIEMLMVGELPTQNKQE